MRRSMRILYFQAIGGASGDMILGALSEVGADLAVVERSLQELQVEPIRIEVEPCRQHGLGGTRVSVQAEKDVNRGRHLSDIRKIVEESTLPAAVQSDVMKVFGRLAEAEGQIHGQDAESIHFHEVGALDSIADIVGACLALRQLNVDAVRVAPLPLGQGTIECSHGTYPAPAPATVRLLAGFPVTFTDVPAELVTPTGAALLTTWHSLDHAPGTVRIVRDGYGFGSRTLEGRPNALRAMILESGEEGESLECLVLECQVDDTQPECIGHFTVKALEAGALDVFTVPVQMKKQRPGTLITVLCDPASRDRILDLLFQETTTFGVREALTTRTILQRAFESVETAYGPVRIKIGTWKGKQVTSSPEFEDCVTLAATNKVPVRAVYEAARCAALQLIQCPSSQEPKDPRGK